jgi:tellurite resistance protein
MHMTNPDRDEPNEQSILVRVARRLGQPASTEAERAQGSILTWAANAYGSDSGVEESRPGECHPMAALLFEALVESAFLVAQADHEFDQAEMVAFQHVVSAACAGAVPERQVGALLADLDDMLSQDGIDKRLNMVARAVARPEHAREVLRVAALLAHASGGVSAAEREVLGKLRVCLGMEEDALEEALREAEQVLSG